MINRVRGDDWIVLRIDDLGYGLSAGAVLRWSDSVCMPMLRGEGRLVVPDIDRAPDVAAAPMCSRYRVGACVCLPMRTSDGTVFGTLCGMSRNAEPALRPGMAEPLETLAGLLEMIFSAELAQINLDRQNERFRFEAMTDALTHLPNRRAWQEKLDYEQARATRLGESAFISVVGLVDLEGVNDREGRAAGDEMLRKAALVLRYAVRGCDFVARLGGNRFGVIGVQSGPVDPDGVSRRLDAELARRGIRASLGTAAGQPVDTLAQVWRNADVKMQRRGTRTGCRT